VTKQKKLWVYAVVLFTCAFIVILATGYSQIKSKNNLNQIRNKAASAERKSASAEQNLNSANKKIDSLQDQVDKQTALNTEMSKQSKLYTDTIASYKGFVKAEKAYKNNNYITCAIILKTQCNSEFLDDETLKTYNSMVSDTFYKAAETLYSRGYGNLENSEYKSAAASFEKSILLKSDGYFTDDCYYFLAYSQYRTDKIEEAKISLNFLLKNYPSSNFLSEANSLLTRINKK
jgi:TolA-binding protein